VVQTGDHLVQEQEQDDLMRVLVTGGTGFVGAHTVGALVQAGHDVRLLVRRAEQVSVSLAPLGVAAEEVVVGDVLDQAAVSAALTGMDAVVHAAAIFSLDPRRAEELTRTNLRATELVLGSAASAGLDPIVHVSSTVALVRRGGSSPELPLGDIELPYSASTSASETYARSLQEAGHPVVSVYPGSVFGPHDPYRGDQNERLRWMLRGLFPVWPRGGMHVVDVRDVAAVVASVLEPGRGPRRYVVPGHHVTGADLYGTLSRVSGRRLRHLELPAGFLAPQVKALQLLTARLPARFHHPADLEGVEINRRDTRVDDTPARTELDVTPRALEETLRDTTRWLVESGRLRPGRAPALARGHASAGVR
jgi:dihydroflavonol-4-reductase